MVLQLYFSCNLHGMRYNVDCHASRLCGRLQTAHTLQNVPDYYNKEEELHMNQFTKAVKSLAAKYNETSLILRIAIGLLIGAALAIPCRARYTPAKPLVARLFLPLLRNKGHETSCSITFLHHDE